MEGLHQGAVGQLELALSVLSLRFLKDAFFVDLGIGLLQVVTMLLSELFLSSCCVLDCRRDRSHRPELWIQTASTWLETTVFLVIRGHEDAWHILLEVIAVEDASAGIHSVLNVFLSEVRRHDNLLVVRLNCSSDHESRWKSP